MTSLSTTRGDLAPTFSTPTSAHPIWRESAPGLFVLALLLAAVVWSAIAQVRSQPLAGEVGPEAVGFTQVD